MSLTYSGNTVNSILRRLGRWLECLAFANDGNFGDFTRRLQRHYPAAPAAPAATPRPLRAARPLEQDANFGHWLAHWNGTPAQACRTCGRMDENV